MVFHNQSGCTQFHQYVNKGVAGWDKRDFKKAYPMFWDTVRNQRCLVWINRKTRDSFSGSHPCPEGYQNVDFTANSVWSYYSSPPSPTTRPQTKPNPNHARTHTVPETERKQMLHLCLDFWLTVLVWKLSKSAWPQGADPQIQWDKQGSNETNRDLARREKEWL